MSVVNLITRETTKEQMLEAYKNYPSTTPKGGFEQFHASTVEPIVCEIPDGSRVLDVGCNDGSMMELLEKKGCKVKGVDVSNVALDIARSKRLKVFNASAENLPFKDKTFDVVVLREVLVHIHEPVKALKEIRRVLRPKGFLLGSAPHANLEKIIWDDKRLHHRYYNEETLKKDLHQAFEKVHMKVLNGAQFLISLSSSLLADQPAEMLFKCGNKNTLDWESALLNDKETLRVWMGPTQPNADAYYRLIGYAAHMREMKGIEIGYEDFNWKSVDCCAEWQKKILPNSDGQTSSSLALHHLEKCLKVANPWIFQVTYYEEIVDLFRCAKDVYKKKKLITDIDDWVFDLPPYNVASNPYKPGSSKEKVVFEQLDLSDVVIVSTNFLKENLKPLFPDKEFHVIPNTIDFEFWDGAKPDNELPKDEGIIRIVYSGCANHSGDMEIVKPVLMGLLEEYKNLEVVIAQDIGCFTEINHPRLKVLGRWVSLPEYPSMLKGWSPDIGIAPLRDNNFNRAKSNLRWLEYSALKVPTVASDVRPFRESLKGENIILCKTKEDWYTSLKNLIESKELRIKYGEAAHNDVKERFNMKTVSGEYADLLKEIRDGRK